MNHQLFDHLEHVVQPSLFILSNTCHRLLLPPSYSLNRLARDLLPLVTMDARGETKGISIRSYTSYLLFPIKEQRIILLRYISIRYPQDGFICSEQDRSRLNQKGGFFLSNKRSSGLKKGILGGFFSVCIFLLGSCVIHFGQIFAFSFAFAKGVILVIH